MRHTEITTLLKLPIHFQGQLANVTRHQTRTLRIRILITTVVVVVVDTRQERQPVADRFRLVTDRGIFFSGR